MPTKDSVRCQGRAGLSLHDKLVCHDGRVEKWSELPKLLELEDHKSQMWESGIYRTRALP